MRVIQSLATLLDSNAPQGRRTKATLHIANMGCMIRPSRLDLRIDASVKTSANVWSGVVRSQGHSKDVMDTRLMEAGHDGVGEVDVQNGKLPWRRHEQWKRCEANEKAHQCA